MGGYLRPVRRSGESRNPEVLMGDPLRRIRLALLDSGLRRNDGLPRDCSKSRGSKDRKPS
jgi:hypothetical protein